MEPVNNLIGNKITENFIAQVKKEAEHYEASFRQADYQIAAM